MKSQLLTSYLLTSSAAIMLLILTACGDSGDTGKSSNTKDQTQTSALVQLDVYKSESCGCCGLWVEHMEGNNFSANIHHPQDLNAIKQQYGIDPQWQSCHTAVSKNGFVFEGHIPAKFVKQFLENPPPDAKGLAVAGMPLGSPGMEVEDRFTPYKIQLLMKDGTTSVYASIDSLSEQF